MTNFLLRPGFPVLILLLTFSLTASAQEKPAVNMVVLGNDNISKVNIDTDRYLADIKQVITILENEAAILGNKQAIGLKVISHKDKPADLNLYSKPKLSSKKQEALLEKIKAVKTGNTKLVDFGLFISFNVIGENPAAFFGVDFFDIKNAKEYAEASLKQKYEINKKWAAEEVLPVLAAYETIVDDKFAGVKGFGQTVASTNFASQQNVDRLTSSNPDYWRAVMEMEPNNQLIPLTKLFMLVAQGDFDHALRYAELLVMFSDPENASGRYLSEFNARMHLFNEQLNTDIDKGIAEHDKENYKKAINLYTETLKVYPNSAWGLYELYYSQNALAIKNGTAEAGGRENWDKAKVAIYRSNPLYNLDVRASSGREAYLLFRRHEVSDLFKNKESRLKDVYEYADIALDLGVYDFAAQFFWISFTFEKEGEQQKKALNRYLYTLEKLGIPQWKSNFEGDFAAIFKAIDDERENKMTESKMYKAFAK